MKGSYLECKFCGLEDLKVNRANETIQCEGCDRILEERYNDFRANAVNFERDSPFCVVTTDELAEHKYGFCREVLLCMPSAWTKAAAAL